MDSDTLDLVNILETATTENERATLRDLYFALKPGCAGIELGTQPWDDSDTYRITSVQYSEDEEVIEISGFKSDDSSLSGVGVRSRIGDEEDGVTLSAGPSNFRRRNRMISREERQMRYDPLERSSRGFALVINIKTR